MTRSVFLTENCCRRFVEHGLTVNKVMSRWRSASAKQLIECGFGQVCRDSPV